MIENERIRVVQDCPADSTAAYVLYWMQQSQRVATNPSLEFAARMANELSLPLVVGFALMSDYPDANERHFAFMLEGLAETATSLAEQGIKMVADVGAPPEVIGRLAADAALVVCDRGYLRHQRKWRRQLARTIDKRVVEIEGDVVVPVACVSDKREWAARTIRAKLNRQRERFIGKSTAPTVQKQSLRLPLPDNIDLRNGSQLLDQLDLSRSARAVDRFKGGTSQARRRLTGFLRSSLKGYADSRNDPSRPQASQLSPYLHFGQISPVEIAFKVQRAKAGSGADKEAFLEELIVRRELAINFVYFTSDYDRFSCLPDWARRTLVKHTQDKRPIHYTRPQMEAAETKDPYWNAAMREMTQTGYMHNYLRMYWGKKILEWCNTPRYAYATALYFNNKYFLDGRDPNSYANVAWLFGLHDRPWQERSIFGQVRYMNAAGLERKFNIDQYVKWTKSLG